MASITTAEPVRKQLDRILSSPGFVRNERLSGFLRFVVQQRLDGKTCEIKESVLGVEVFGRTPGYDTRSDSIVRTEAAKLRTRLTEYYAGEGASDRLLIELPKGGYTPEFHPREVTHETAAIASDRARRRKRKWRWVLAGCTCAMLLLATIGLWQFADRNAPIPIAVLPLANLSQDAPNDYFADGLTDEIIRNLSILDGLAVRSQTSSFAFKGKPRDMREAGRQLGVDYILEGSVMRAGQKLRINVQFVRVRDDFPLWSGRYDRQLTDVFSIQDEISRGIVDSLRLKLGRGRRHYETSPEAYDLYLRGIASVPRVAPSVEDENRAVAAFEQAIAKDAFFAPAYAGLAAARAYRSGLFRLDPDDEIPKMRSAAQKAIELDPLLPEAHEALGIGSAREARWRESENSFRRALELDPNRSETHYQFAIYVLWPLDRTAEALKELRLAERADPLSRDIWWLLAYMLPSVGRYDEAARYAELARSAALLGRARFLEGRTDEAVQMLEQAFGGGVGITTGDEVRAYLGYAYARTGRRDEAERMAVGTNPFNQAVIFAGLGDRERALEAMERSTVAGPVRVGRQLMWPELLLIHNEPRMKSLRRKVGLPE
jgi:TolB-like protein